MDLKKSLDGVKTRSGNMGYHKIVVELILRLVGFEAFVSWCSGARHGEYWRDHLCLQHAQMDLTKSLNGIKTRSGNMGYHKIVYDWSTITCIPDTGS